MKAALTRSHRTAGFTFIEMMVALLIFTAVMVAAIPVMLRDAQYNTASDDRTQAAVAVQQVLDSYRNLYANSTSTVPTSGSSTSSVTTGNRTYTVTVTYCALSALCSGYARELTAVASRGGNSVLSVETVLTPLNTDN